MAIAEYIVGHTMDNNNWIIEILVIGSRMMKNKVTVFVGMKVNNNTE